MNKKNEMKQLKSLLKESNSLGKVVDYFLKNFPESGNWNSSGSQIEKPALEKIIVHAVSSKFEIGQEYTFIAAHDKSNKLIHGALNFGYYMGMFFYVPAIARGIVSINSITNMTKMDHFRFTFSDDISKHAVEDLGEIEEVALSKQSSLVH